MTDAAVTILRENIKQLFDLHITAGLELEALDNELSLLNSYLKMAAEITKKTEALRELERQMKEVFYDIEDTIEFYLGQAVAAKGKNFLWRSLGRKHVRLAKNIGSLRKDKVNRIFEIVDGLQGDLERHRKLQIDERVQSVGEGNVVRLKDEEETIIKYIKQETKEIDFISIIGISGLGKTTLAWKIYQNPIIQYEFPTRIWVFVSHDSEPKNVFLNILKQLTTQDMSSLGKDELASEIFTFLEKSKFLLVLDGVWNFHTVDAIKSALPGSNHRGKVLITSRSMDIGRYANRTRQPHMLRFLTVEESWELLQLEVFGKLGHCPQELRTIGRTIATQCDGLPLAVIVMGSILKGKISAGEYNIEWTWRKVSEDLGASVEKRVSDIVEHTYNRLPVHLRNCFLYLGVFPEDYEIPVWTLTRLWIAEGFIQPVGGQETALEILEDLITKNLLMIEKLNIKGEVKTCRVKDVIRGFCISKAGIKEQNLFQDITKSRGVFEPSVSDIQKSRRLCVHSHLRELLSRKIKGRRVRSFLCFSKEPIILPQEYISAVPDSFDLLRVLDSKSFKFTQFPQKITKLIHLRYITLSCDELKVLPEAVSQLWNLQTLVVDTKSDTLEIKGRIGKMIQLTDLKTKAAIILAKQGDKASKKLQTLSRISPKYCTKDAFESAHSLKSLGIRGQLASLLDANYLNKLDHLENLKLVNDLYSESASETLSPGLPPLNWFPRNIKNLTLSSTSLDWKHMSTLGKIDTLEVLKLKKNAFRGKVYRAVDGGFRRLKYLLIESSNLLLIEASDHHFRSLRCLVLKNCKRLHKFPAHLAEDIQKVDTQHVRQSSPDDAANTKTMWDHMANLQWRTIA